MKKTLWLVLLLAGLTQSARAFSLLGPYKTWQVTPLGYNLFGDIGGPMTGSEGYRWNVPTIYYALDQSFIAYFGSNGITAIDQAMKIFNDLPKFSLITNDDSSLYINGQPVPTDTKGPQNFGLNVAGVYDLKSRAMGMVLEELGLAQPSRWTWTLRARNTETIGGVVFTNYTVIKLNYDPITYQPSSYVNGQLYSYHIEEPIPIPMYADAIEDAVNPPSVYTFSAVADQTIFAGEYYFGLTQDDVAGLRFLYNKNNLATEQLLTSVIGGQRLRRGSPWAPYVGLTNFINSGTNNLNLMINTNTLIRTGIRPGINKLNFKRINFDSLIGQVTQPVTQFYDDIVISNAVGFSQPVQRIVLQPDILFTAEDLGLVLNLTPILTARSGTVGQWQDNDALNGNAPQRGPGVIPPQVTIRFSDQLPYFSNTNPGSTEDDAFASAVWGSFDENSVEPVIYPAYLGLTLKDIQRLVKQGGP